MYGLGLETGQIADECRTNARFQGINLIGGDLGLKNTYTLTETVLNRTKPEHNKTINIIMKVLYLLFPKILVYTPQSNYWTSGPGP